MMLLTRMALCIPRRQKQMNSSSESQYFAIFGSEPTGKLSQWGVSYAPAVRWEGRTDGRKDREEKTEAGGWGCVHLTPVSGTLNQVTAASDLVWSAKLTTDSSVCCVTFLTSRFLFWMTAICNTPTHRNSTDWKWIHTLISSDHCLFFKLHWLETLMCM